VREWRRTSKNLNFPGLVISEDEVDALLTKNLENDLIAEAQAEQEALEKSIAAKKAASKQKGVELRLDVLAETFGLGKFEVDVLLAVSASELFPKYGKLFAYLQDDLTKKHATVGLVISLFLKGKEDKLAAREHFSYDAPLIKNLILHLQESDVPLIEKTVKLDDRIISFLLCHDELDPSIASFSKLKTAQNSFENLVVPDQFKQRLQKFASALADPKPVVLLAGTFELPEVAQAICHQNKTPILSADLEQLKGENIAGSLRLFFREAKLQKAAVYLEKFEVAGDEVKRAALEEINFFGGLTFIPNASVQNLKRRSVTIAVPQPKYDDRLKIWQALAGDVEGIGDVAVKFKFGQSKAKAALKTAKSIAYMRDPASPTLKIEDIYAGCRAQLKPVSHATKVSPLYKWDDIVLPQDRKKQLLEVCSYVKNYPKVYESWGFDKHSRGKGLNVLFSGPSGTGKTMAAEIIAGELGVDMYKIDLSMVISKYIGETEKNLNQIFKDAENANAVLFFDEADALFGKRSEVKDAHDRYANIEINYLLQKMEEHEGIVVLATNMQRNVDDAFLRRMNFIVEFPFPSQADRLAIWRKVFPAEMPKDAKLDFECLAKLQVSGGNIKNIAVTAAFLAAESKNVVAMLHLIKAVRQEYQKTGRILAKQELDKYGQLL
jgi:SpoVK/Ycf46/Vps4 family AAA+-type ATPase